MLEEILNIFISCTVQSLVRKKIVSCKSEKDAFETQLPRGVKVGDEFTLVTLLALLTTHLTATCHRITERTIGNNHGFRMKLRIVAKSIS